MDAESFFNLFKTRKAPESDDEPSDEDDEEKQKAFEQFDDDIRLAEEIARQVVPRALYYYLGIAEDKDDNPEDSMEDEEPEEDED